MIVAVPFADEAAKFVAENQQEIDFSAERLDEAFCVSDKLLQQNAANQGYDRQQSEYLGFPRDSCIFPAYFRLIKN